MDQFKQHRSWMITLMLFLMIMLNQEFVFSGIAAAPEIEVHQLHLKNIKAPVLFSQIGTFTLHYTPEATASFVNVIAKNKDKTGYFWLIRNLYLPDAAFTPTLQQVSVPFDWTNLGYKEGDSVTGIELTKVTSTEIKNELPNTGEFIQVMVDTLSEETWGFETAFPAEMPKLAPVDFYPSFTKNDAMSVVEYRGCTVPNLDLNNSAFGPDANYAGDWKACGPVAAANNLHWLADFHAEITLPGDLREVTVELSGIMERPVNQGVTIEKFIQGKLDFIEKHNLPVNVKFQSQTTKGDLPSSKGETWARDEKGNAKYPTWEWLKAEMDAGEAIEAMYFWWDGEKWRGHAVAVTGVEETANGLKTIKFKHDMRQSMAGGALQECESVIIDAEGRMAFRARPAYIAHLVAESPGKPFPVEMSAFQALVRGNDVQVVWQTASETNNYGFEIQKNSQKIGFVHGHGTTAQPQNYEFTDRGVGSGNLSYSLIQIDYDGTRNLAGTREVVLHATATDFVLTQNYPNPFNPTTTIHFSIPEKGLVRLSVFNILGEEIRTLVSEEMPAGAHQVQFDGRDLQSGIYYYSLETAGFRETKKLILLK